MNNKPPIWSLITKNWKWNLLYVLIAAMFSGINTFSTYSLGIWIGTIAEYAANKNNQDLKSAFHLWTILASGSLFLSFVILLIYQKYVFLLDIKNTRFLSKLINSKIISLEYQKYNQRTAGNYLSWFDYDMHEIKTNFISGVYGLVDYCFNIGFISIALFITNWIMAIIVLSMFCLINLIPKLISKYLEKINLKTSNLIELVYGKLQKLLDLWTFFSLKNLRNKFSQQFTKSYADLRKNDLKKGVLDMPYEILLDILFIIGIGLTFIIAIVLKQSNLIKLSTIGAAVILANRIMSSGLGSASLLLRFNSVKKLYDKIFDLPNSLISKNDLINKIDGFQQINIKNLTYQYQDQDEKVIKKFNYQFHRGKKYLIMAPSGYGKSTLIKIMAGLFKDYDGQVLWNNNQELKFINDQLLRKYVSYVDNNNYIMEDEGFETNVTMWSEFNQERFDRIVKLLVIKNLKNHFDHHKNALSEGQKQKIAFARMLYDNRPIIFLDEALDNIDQNYKEKLINVFQNLAQWKTLIVVTHNMKSEHRMIFDEVIYLDQLGE